jgi:hypothetical protein
VRRCLRREVACGYVVMYCMKNLGLGLAVGGWHLRVDGEEETGGEGWLVAAA